MIRYTLACAHNEDTNKSAHYRSLTRVLALRLVKCWTLCYPYIAYQRLLSDCLAEMAAYADLSL